MQVKTLGLLSLVAMLCSSAAVWSLTDPHARAQGPDVRGGAPTSPTSAPPPQAGAQFRSGQLVMLEGRLGHAVLPAAGEQESYLFLSARAEDGAVASTPASLNLAIVLDRSGSMRGKRLENALSAARGMVDRLRDGDVVSVVTYNTGTDVVVAPTPIDSASRSRVMGALARMTASGDTCVSCGIETAAALLGERSNMIDRVLLLSDGEATAGVLDEAGFRQLAAGLRRRNIAVSSIGVDVEYNERVLAALAQESNGRHYFVETPASLAAIFDQELQSLVRTVAEDAELALDLSPGVDVMEVYDRSFRRDGARLVVPLGGLAAGEEKTLLVRVRVPRGAPGSALVANARMTYRDLVARKAGECSGSLFVERSADRDVQVTLDPFVQTRVLRSETAQTLTDTNKLLKEGRADEARARLSKSIRKLKTARTAARAMPSAVARDLESSLGKQEDALGSAEGVFAEPPPPGAQAGSGFGRGAPATAAPAPKKSAAQVRKNQEAAVDFAQ